MGNINFNMEAFKVVSLHFMSLNNLSDIIVKMNGPYSLYNDCCNIDYCN